METQWRRNMTDAVSSLYERHVLPARTRLRSYVTNALLDPKMKPAHLELFLIHYCARAVPMTEPVEGWIRRAGERCEELGFAQLGRSLRMHARHEANHHLMLIEDVKRLVEDWNQRSDSALEVDALLHVPPTPAIRAYVSLHEDVIAGPAPFCQLAIEYEIEGLSVNAGPDLIKQCERLLGPAFLQKLSFLTEHVSIDVGHTKFNHAQLEKLLAGAPSLALTLGATGDAALKAYGAFLVECFACARHETTQTQAKVYSQHSSPR
jgi:hypothetical protein